MSDAVWLATTGRRCGRSVQSAVLFAFGYIVVVVAAQYSARWAWTLEFYALWCCRVCSYGVVHSSGCYLNGSLHIGTMLYVADAIFFFTLFYYIWASFKVLGYVQHRLDSELGNPVDAYLSTMRIGLFMVCAFAIISPLYILSRPLLFVFGPLGLISLSLFIVSFTALGFSMSEGVTEIVAETNEEMAAAKVFSEIVPERVAEIDMAVSKWRSEGGFRDSDLTLSSFARRIKVNRADVVSYLTSIYGKSFRTWLSGIRVEEAKALIVAHPEYSNEVVSMECGFSSRVYFQRLFKERTGLTPAEWRRQR